MARESEGHMSKMFGADTNELRLQAVATNRGADSLRTRGQQLLGRVAEVKWIGPDADDFLRNFDTHIQRLEHLADTLNELAREMERQAAEQDVTSESRGQMPNLSAHTGGANGPSLSASLGNLGNLAGSASQAAPASNGDSARDRFPGVFPPRNPPQGVSEAEARAAMNDFANEPNPREVADMYDDYAANDPEMLDAMAYYFPEQFGNLKGIPGHAADRANRWALEDVINAGGPDAQSAEAIAAELGSNRAEKMQLLGLERTRTNGPWGAQVCYGDIDKATNTSFVVPGMISDVGFSSIESQGEACTNLREAMLKKNGGLTPDDVAVVSYIDYDTPTHSEEPYATRAEAGAHRLQETLAGHQARHPDESNTTNVIGFSYGTTVVGEALLTGGPTYGVDNVVLQGSAGLTDNVDGFRHDAPDAPSVYATDATADRVNNFGQLATTDHPNDPLNYSWVTGYSSDGESIRVTREPMNPYVADVYQPVDYLINPYKEVEVPGQRAVEGHTLGSRDKVGYMSEDSQSLDYIADKLAK